MSRFEEIEKYLNGEMSAEERASFEQELETNNSLKEALKKVQLANELIAFQSLMLEKEKLNKFHPKPKKTKWWIIGGSAIVVAVITILAWPKDEAKPADDNLTVENNSINTDTVSTSNSNNLDTIVITNNDGEQVVVVAPLTKVDEDNNFDMAEITPTDTIEIIPADTSKAIDDPDPDQKDPETNPEKDPPPPDPCAGVTLNFELVSFPTCPDVNEGRVSVINVSGGTPPYAYAFNGSTHLVSDFYNVAPGEYHIRIKDSNSCPSAAKKTTVKTKSCVSETPIIISLGQTEKWDIARDNDEACRVIIYNQNGQTLMDKFFEQSEPASWDLKDKTGNQVQEGVYIYKITTSSGKKTTGDLTIIF